jgi:hypothetical protein
MLPGEIALIFPLLAEMLTMNKNINPEIAKFIISNIASGNAYRNYSDAIKQALQIYSIRNPNYKFAYTKYNYPEELAGLTEHVVRIGPEIFHQFTTHPKKPMQLLTTYVHSPNTIHYISFKTQNSEVSVMPATEIEGNFKILPNTDLCLERRAKLVIYEEHFSSMAFIADLEQILNSGRVQLLSNE